MNKCFNVFNLLLLIALSHANENLISFSDLVSSLIQLDVDKSSNLINLNRIKDDFEKSNDFLKVMLTSNDVSCEKRKDKDDKKENEISSKIQSFYNSIKKLEEKNNRYSNEIEEDKKSIEEEVTKIKKVKASIVQLKKESLEKEKEIYETIRIFQRLKNLAEDELIGTSKKQTEMNNFNLTVITPTSFIQNAQYMKTELKSIYEKNKDYFDKGYYSTLLLLTQNLEKGRYSNPETIKKIINIIENILININRQVFENQRTHMDQEKDMVNVIENSRNMITRLYEEIQFRIQSTFTHQKDIVFYNNDIIFLNKSLLIRKKRNSFIQNLCKQNGEFLKKHFKYHLNTMQNLDDLKSQLSE